MKSLKNAIDEYQKENYSNAIKICKKIVDTSPFEERVGSFLAGLYQVTGAYKEAIKVYKKLNVNQNINRQIGMCFFELEAYKESIQYYKKSLKETQSDQNTLSLIIESCQKGGLWTKATYYAQKLHRLDPTNINIMIVLGVSFLEQGKYTRAIGWFEKVIEHDSKCISAYKNLAISYNRNGQVMKEWELLKKSLEISKTDLEILKRLVRLCMKYGDSYNAQFYLKEAIKIDPSFSSQVIFNLFVPASCHNREEIQYWRSRFESNVDELTRKKSILKDPFTELEVTNFYLVYQGENDRKIQEKTAALYGSYYPKVEMPKRKKKKGGKRSKKIQIGFFSRFFTNQSVSHFYKNMMINLPEMFEMHTFHVQAKKKDEVTRAIIERSDHYYEVPESIEAARALISKKELDLLVYPEIGMDPVTYYTALTRLAPIQCVLMGHPVTSGMKSMDYYVSSDLFESEVANAHYTEQLVRIKGMPIDYSLPTISAPYKTRKELGLPENRHLYLCPMILFKIQPEFDDAIVEILRQDPKGEVIFFNYYRIGDLLKARLQKTAPDVYDRVRFIQPVTQALFLSYLACADVVLESFPFGGGNTALLTFSTGTPFVTFPTEFLRGRFSYGYYKRLNYFECVAHSAESYVKKCVDIAKNPDYRASIKDKILSCKPILFHNQEGRQNMVKWFEKIVRNRSIRH